MRVLRTVLVVAAALVFASQAPAHLVDVYSIDGPQDPLFVEWYYHELGNNPPFPIDEWIDSCWIETTLTSCWDGSDDPLITNVLVSITNRTNIFWWDLHYVADPETTISNFDGWIGNVGMGDAEEAFRIDYPGINIPLVSESMTADEIFEPGETWEFILQDFANPHYFPAAFDSLGIAGASCGYPPSTGSIIALVPSPGAFALLVLGGLMGRRRRR